MRLHPSVHLQSLLDVQCVLAMFLIAVVGFETPGAFPYDAPPLDPMPPLPADGPPPLLVHLGNDAIGFGRDGIATRCRSDGAWGWLDDELRSDLRSSAARVVWVDVEDGVVLDDVIRAMSKLRAAGYAVELSAGWPPWMTHCD